jgi:hypothetical protein
MHQSESPRIKSSEVIDVGDDTSIRFRRFRLLPHTRRLFIDEQPVALGSRRFDLLMVLVKANGRLVTKTEILARVWPDTVRQEGDVAGSQTLAGPVVQLELDVADQPAADFGHYARLFVPAAVEPGIRQHVDGYFCHAWKSVARIVPRAVKGDVTGLLRIKRLGEAGVDVCQDLRSRTEIGRDRSTLFGNCASRLFAP